MILTIKTWHLFKRSQLVQGEHDTVTVFYYRLESIERALAAQATCRDGWKRATGKEIKRNRRPAPRKT